MSDVIMSHIFNSFYTHRALESIGSGRHVYLVDNSFMGDMKRYAQRHPHVHYLRPKVRREIDVSGATRMSWSPLSCSESWNEAMNHAQSDWVVNINPDMMVTPQTFQLLDMAIEGRGDKTVLIRTQFNFNIWAADRRFLLEMLSGFDERYKPCAGEDEDILCQIADAGVQWTKMGVPGYHQDGGHIDRADMGMDGKTYPNAEVFREKWGWLPHSSEYNAKVGAAFAGGA